MSHDVHTREPAERSHPILWTLGLVVSAVGLSLYFTVNYRRGAVVGRDHGHLAPSAASGPVEPDHLALIADRSDEVLEKGGIVWSKNCASCHGAEGNANPTKLNPPPRNFWTDAFKNPNGGGAYGLYTVMAKGFNGMPAFPALSSQDRYAVVHFVRERLVKPNNPDNYQEDSAEIVANIPAAGGAAAGPTEPPHLRPVPAPSYALLAGVAQASEPSAKAAAAWLDRAVDGAEGRVGDLLRRIATSRASAYHLALARATVKNDRDALTALVINPPLGVPVRTGAQLTASEFDALIAQLRNAKPPTSAGVP